MEELPIIQKVFDLIKWYIPILNRLPKTHRFGLGERMVTHRLMQQHPKISWGI
nr:hypothetical protein [Acaryochloris sp. IP29b_bin.137]